MADDGHGRGPVRPVIGADRFIERRRGPADRRRQNLRPLVGGRRASDPPTRQSDPTSRGVPLLVEASSVNRARHVIQVGADEFTDMMERLDLPVVTHYTKRPGQHIYMMAVSGVVFETHTPQRLPLIDAAAQEMERQGVRAARPAPRATRPGGTAPPPQSQAETKTEPPRPQPRPEPPSPEAKPEPPRPRPKPPSGAGGRRKPPSLMEFPIHHGVYVTEWWNKSEDASLSVARIRIEVGAGTGEYELHGITERYLFLKGHGRVEVNGKSYEVGPGDGMLVKAGVRRRISNTGNGDMGLLAICRPRFSRREAESDQYRFVKRP